MDWAAIKSALEAFSNEAIQVISKVGLFLEGQSFAGRLAKDTLVAVGITAFSSFVINGVIQYREAKQRGEVANPIRDLVLESISTAHADIMEAVDNFDVRDGKHLPTRIRRLSTQLSAARALSLATVLSGFGYFEPKQKKAIGEYMKAILWDRKSSSAKAALWIDQVNLRFEDVKAKCGTHALLSWSRADILRMKENLLRLDGPRPATAPPVSPTIEPALGGFHRPANSLTW
jgi:hypothetical protein